MTNTKPKNPYCMKQKNKQENTQIETDALLVELDLKYGLDLAVSFPPRFEVYYKFVTSTRQSFLRRSQQDTARGIVGCFEVGSPGNPRDFTASRVNKGANSFVQKIRLL